MRALHVHYGLDAYSFEALPLHIHSKTDVEDDDIKDFVNQAHEDLERGKCFWYHIVVLDFNPYTGETSSQYIHDCVKEKEKIILNASARIKTPKVSLNEMGLAELQDLLFKAPA